MANALFICDIQERFRDVVIGSAALIAAARALIEVWIVLGEPIVVSEQVPSKLGKTVPEIEEVLSAVPAHLLLRVEKSAFSMMENIAIHRFISDHGIARAFIVGLEAHVCVLQTARDVVDHRLAAYVCADAVTSQRAYDRRIAFRAAESAGAHMTTVEAAIFQVVKDAEHPRFKEIVLINKNRNSLMHSDEKYRALSVD